NLLSNAIKYAPKDSKILFEASRQDKSLVLSIINKSESVGKKDLSKLFRRFYQDNKLSEGVGVGLALVRELVTLSKGSIIANNIDDYKIQFTVSLPSTKASFSDDEAISTEDMASSETSLKPSIKVSEKDKPLLLIVEDEADIRTFIVSIFKNDYRIIES